MERKTPIVCEGHHPAHTNCYVVARKAGNQTEYYTGSHNYTSPTEALVPGHPQRESVPGRANRNALGAGSDGEGRHTGHVCGEGAY